MKWSGGAGAERRLMKSVCAFNEDEKFLCSNEAQTAQNCANPEARAPPNERRTEKNPTDENNQIRPLCDGVPIDIYF